MHRRRFLAGSAALAGVVGMGTGFSPAHANASTIGMTVATGHPPVVTWVNMLDNFFLPEVDRRLEEAGNYRIEWTKGYAGTIARIGGEVEAVDQNITDLAIVGATFNPALLPLQNVSYYTPFASEDISTVVRAVDELHNHVPAMQKLWDDNNQVYLAGIGIDCFQLFSRDPITSLGDMDGLKIGGIGPNLNWLRGAGIAPVQVDPNAAYNDLQTGVYDGLLVTPGLGANLRIHEVAPHILEANFGAMSWGALSINRDRFDSLPEEVQQVIREVGRDYQARMIEFQGEAEQKGRSVMLDAGLTITEMSADARKEWADTLPHLAKEWADGLEERGLPAREVVRAYIDVVRENGGAVVRDWSEGL